jgi:phage baseplate assembly protein gpV
MIKFAEVKSRNLEKGTVRVVFKEDEELESYDLPVLQLSTQASKSLSLPDIGEQVAVAMAENMVDGCVLGCMYNDVDAPGFGSETDGFAINTESGSAFYIGKQTKQVNLSGGGGAMLDLSDAATTLTGNTALVIEGTADCKITIRNGAEDIASLITELLTAIKSITVSTGTGPSGTPINAAEFAALETKFASLFTA